MLKPFLTQLLAGQSLSSEQMARAMGHVMDGEASEIALSAFLIALRMKGETADEIAGAARAMRAHATVIQPPAGVVVDTCGTGGDARGTFNISTTAAFVVAAAGAVVAKHGNHSNTSASGSADVLRALGVQLDAGSGTVEDCLREVGLGFLYAPRLHPAMRHAAGVRRELGVRSIFNLLGPLANPAAAPFQVIGVYEAALVPVMLEAVRALGATGAMVVHGTDGLDEVSTCADTLIGEWRDGQQTFYRLDARELGLARANHEQLQGGSPEDNAAIARDVLRGQSGPRRDIVLLNAAAALKVAGLASGWQDGLRQAAEAIDQGRALAKLESLVAATRLEKTA